MQLEWILEFIIHIIIEWIASQTYNSMNWYNNNTFMPVRYKFFVTMEHLYIIEDYMQRLCLGNGRMNGLMAGTGVSVKQLEAEEE